MPDDPFVRVWPDAARALDLTKDQAYKLARKDRLLGLTVHKRGRTPVVARAELDQLLGRTDAPTPLTVMPNTARAASPDATLLRHTDNHLTREIETAAERLAYLEWQRLQVRRELRALEDSSQGRAAAR